MVIGPVEYKINIRLKNTDDFEIHTNAIDVDYDSGDVTYTVYDYKLNTPQFNVVKGSANGKGTNYVKEIVEYHGQKCYIPTSGRCFIKCFKYFTNKNYAEVSRDFIKNEKYRSGVIAFARIHPYSKKHDINIDCFDGNRMNPRNITEKNR